MSFPYTYDPLGPMGPSSISFIVFTVQIPVMWHLLFWPHLIPLPQSYTKFPYTDLSVAPHLQHVVCTLEPLQMQISLPGTPSPSYSFPVLLSNLHTLGGQELCLSSSLFSP